MPADFTHFRISYLKSPSVKILKIDHTKNRKKTKNLNDTPKK